MKSKNQRLTTARQFQRQWRRKIDTNLSRTQTFPFVFIFYSNHQKAFFFKSEFEKCQNWNCKIFQSDVERIFLLLLLVFFSKLSCKLIWNCQYFQVVLENIRSLKRLEKYIEFFISFTVKPQVFFGFHIQALDENPKMSICLWTCCANKGKINSNNSNQSIKRMENERKGLFLSSTFLPFGGVDVLHFIVSWFLPPLKLL